MATPYMNLSLPTVSITAGPLWATQLNAALNLLDAHDHTSAKGNQVPSAGLNINADLDLEIHSLFNSLSLKFSSQTATLVGSANASSIYVVSGDLYYTNGAGVAVQLTTGGSIVGTPGTIQAYNYLAVSSDLTISSADQYVFYSIDTSASRIITMPLANSVTTGRIYIIKDATGSAYSNSITITASGSDTVDNESTYVLNSGCGSISVVSDGISNWQIA